jgi:chloramphenicol-sensitive protein RarD
MTEAGKGVLAMVAACTVWGLSPLFYIMLADIPPAEVLAHRTLWSVVVFAGLLTWQGRLHEVPLALNTARKLVLVVAATAMISTNWFLFIFAVGAGRTVEASLGYYIYPLVAVLIGALVLREPLGRAQVLAVALAATAVLVLSLGLGAPPWISLTLATTFGVYGLLKRWVASGPVVSVTTEVLVVAPFGLAYLILWGSGAFGGDARTTVLLILSGPLTAIPLILFSYAVKRTAMATVGLLQYINPTLQFGVAVLILNEVATIWHAIAFPLIWLALATYSTSAIRAARLPRPPPS